MSDVPGRSCNRDHGPPPGLKGDRLILSHQPIAFEPTLTSEEAARLLNIHPKTLQRMARRGQVPAHRIGDLWRFRASELDAWFRGKRGRLESPLVP